jgi:hypothetical protein
LPKGVDLLAVFDEALGKVKGGPRGFEGLLGIVGQAQAEDVRDVMRESIVVIPEFEDVLRGYLLGPAKELENQAQYAQVAAAFAGFNTNLQGSLRDLMGKLQMPNGEVTDLLNELEIRTRPPKEKKPEPTEAPKFDPAAIEKQFAEARAALKTELAAHLAKGGIAAEEIMAELFDPPPKAKPPEQKPAEQAPPEGEQKMPEHDKAAVEKSFKDANSGFKNQLSEQLQKAGVESADIADLLGELFPKG